jgi:hypothetical protein
MNLYIEIHNDDYDYIIIADNDTHQGLLDINQNGLYLWGGLNKKYYDTLFNSGLKGSLIIDGIDIV